MEKLHTTFEPTSQTVSDIAQVIKSSWYHEAYLLSGKIILHIQDYEEQRAYFIFMDKTKYDAVCCLLWNKNCGGGEV